MMRNNLLLILLTLLFTACVERGHSLKPVQHSPFAQTMTKETQKTITSTEKMHRKKVQVHASVKKSTPVVLEERKVKKSTTVVNIGNRHNDIKDTTSTEDNYFTLSDETKNTISGIFVFIIGIIILL